MIVEGPLTITTAVPHRHHHHLDATWIVHLQGDVRRGAGGQRVLIVEGLDERGDWVTAVVIVVCFSLKVAGG